MKDAFKIKDRVKVLKSQYDWLVGCTGRVASIRNRQYGESVYNIVFDDESITERLVIEEPGGNGKHEMLEHLLSFVSSAEPPINVEGLI